MSNTCSQARPALLALADGTIFNGTAFGAVGEYGGEVVFHTGLTGYQEVLTDPSSYGQIVSMTYTQQGNYGLNPDDNESWRAWAGGMVVREACPYPSNFTSTITLPEYLREQGVVGIAGVDTRRLTRHLRQQGTLSGVISSVDLNPDSLIAKAQGLSEAAPAQWVGEVSCRTPRRWGESGYGDETPQPEPRRDSKPEGEAKRKPRMIYREGVPLYAPQIFRVVCLDWGIKQNLLRHLYYRGCDLIVVPAETAAAEILQWQPDGVLLAGGPGNPEALAYGCETVQGLLGQVPLFGVGLGHQVMALSLGGTTYKLQSGHRGSNHPVQNLKTGRVEITGQNHGYNVDADSLKNSGLCQTHINLNDQSCEGLAHCELPLFSVQYQPEAGPGPSDASYLLDDFIKMMSGDWAAEC